MKKLLLVPSFMMMAFWIAPQALAAKKETMKIDSFLYESLDDQTEARKELRHKRSKYRTIASNRKFRKNEKRRYLSSTQSIHN